MKCKTISPSPEKKSSIVSDLGMTSSWNYQEWILKYYDKYVMESRESENLENQ